MKSIVGITIHYQNRAVTDSMRSLAAAGLTDLKFVTGQRIRSLSAAEGGSCDRPMAARLIADKFGASRQLIKALLAEI
ncbi:hypothetical protein [Pseudomonas fluorescens]|uniref:hypothetical protein n=1 Tax=Pseudomonas fluorescens TaxID=294 RepID=UPI00123F7E8E|nr:hypothetical protein [Pseudomonas fluorescens]